MKKLYLAVTVLLAMTGCSQNEIAENTNDSQNVLYAEMQEPQSTSRLIVDGMSVNWAKGDAFLALTDDPTNPTTTTYTLVGEGNTKTGTFATTNKVTGVKSAIYPADIYLDTFVDGDYLYLISDLPNTYENGTASLNRMPLYGQIEGSKVTFCHTISFFKITVSGLDATKYKKLKVNCNRGIAGYLKMDMKGKNHDASIYGKYTGIHGSGSEYNKKDVFFDYDGKETVFYLPVPAITGSKGYREFKFFGFTEDNKQSDVLKTITWEAPGIFFEAGKVYEVTVDATGK